MVYVLFGQTAMITDDGVNRIFGQLGEKVNCAVHVQRRMRDGALQHSIDAYHRVAGYQDTAALQIDADMPCCMARRVDNVDSATVRKNFIIRNQSGYIR